MITLKNLTKYFGKLKIVENCNLVVPDGSSVAIIGPSGCGKSTLLRLIIRLTNPTAGSIIVDGRDVASLSDDSLIELRKKIGMIFQTSALFDSLNVHDNVAFALHEHTRLSEREINRIVKEKLKMVELLVIDLRFRWDKGSDEYPGTRLSPL